MKDLSCDVLIVGAGIVGIATAHYLKVMKPSLDVVLVDSAQPMTCTSAVSGENYRNWWPHPVMTQFTDRSIDLMEELACETNNRIGMSRRGYALATRSSEIEPLLEELAAGYAGAQNIRLHGKNTGTSYQAPVSADWTQAPDGVDVLTYKGLIRRTFPSFDKSVQTVVHIRRAGAVDSQQLGQYCLERFREGGGRRLSGTVTSINKTDDFIVHLTGPDTLVRTEQIVNAAGPWIGHIASLMGSELPVVNVMQQKIAFEDTAKAIPRDMPFAIDLDAQLLDWTNEERKLLASEPQLERFTQEMRGATHCRPEGGDHGNWLKLGWAYNEEHGSPSMEPELSQAFIEIVLKGAARLNPSLKTYDGRLPAGARHYGGYYTMTTENWPLIGPTDVEGAYVVGAMSGFGTMAACSGGELCARHVIGAELPAGAYALSLGRYEDDALMGNLQRLSSRGIL